ncbi:FkbM family methyltransferase [Methanobacterium alcaliphilum]|uniref:FkbM family methyltransferase n=1 Tax=Methanobacterium alcaliphilum TaxID=392018 RepID=UPI002009FB1A|nr:FkbM family methyltransferase [Methanobacterium alcaliphilum]MCK9152233.1 FkbM family methyltransferase [Methanobacterium alcaliphilum]
MTIKNPIKLIKKANKSFNIYLKNYKKINKFIKDYYKNSEEIKDFIELYKTDQVKLNNRYKKLDNDHDNFDRFIGDWSSRRLDIDNAIHILNENYKKTKEYFFNGDELLFKEMLVNTDHFFQMCYYNNIELLAASFAEKKIYLKTEDGIILSTNNRSWTIEEIFARNGYSIPQLYAFKEFVVFDIGMNRGYASLKFASLDSCKAVFGFEIDDNTYEIALENFKLNKTLSNKINAYNFGLYDEEKDLELYYIPGYDGITTANLEFAKTQSEWVREQKQMKIKKSKVKMASDVISTIIKNENITSNIVLKIDTEGAEHKIIDDLISHDLLDKIDVIMGEIHLETQDLESKLQGFKKIRKEYITESVYNFCFVKEKFYNEYSLAE